jgi:oxalate---CoA ligase
MSDGLLMTLIEERARVDPHRIYLTDARRGRRLSYAALGHRVRGWRAALDQRAVPPGGRVAVAVAEPLDFAVAFLGVLAAGRHALPVAGGAQLGPSLDRLAPDLVIADHDLRQDIDPRHHLATPDAYRAAGPGAGSTIEDGLTGVLLASSGTTGAPKQVFLDIGRLLHVATAVARHHRLTPADVGYNSLPLVHVNAEVVGLLATLVAGAELVVDARFRRGGFWDLVESRRITWINAVPAILAILAREPAPTPAQRARVRFVRSASAPLPAAVLASFEAVTGLPVIETYGMTEAASQITANPVGAGRRRGSVGRAVAAEIRVVDAAGRGCPAGVTGQVLIRGRGVIRAYATETGNDRFRAGGWLATGDLGRLDADGFLYLVGRTDDVINRGGEKIFPREIEEVLLTDPRVARAVVVAAPDDVLGAVPVARVQPVAPEPAADDEATVRGWAPRGAVDRDRLRADLAELCAARLERFKLPVRVDIVDNIPVGQTGKVLRRLIQVDSAVGGSVDSAVGGSEAA